MFNGNPLSIDDCKQLTGSVVKNIPDVNKDDAQYWANNDQELKAVLYKALCREGASPTQPKEFVTWRTVTIGGIKKKTLNKHLHDSTSIVSKWAVHVLGKDECSIADKKTELELVKASVAELGFTETTRRHEIYKQAFELGLDLCPAEIGPQLRLQYIYQPKGEWLVIAMEPIKDWAGKLNVFHVRRYGCGDRYLDARDGEPNDKWDPDALFVFVRRKKT